MSVLAIRNHYNAVVEFSRLMLRHRQLTWEMTKREFSERYAGQILGCLWAVGHPLALMGIYIAVFTLVFKVRIGGTYDLPLDYTAYLLSGLIPWMTFQESMAKSTPVIVANSSLVKQVVFPLEILPVKTVMAAFVTQFVAGGILTAYVLYSHGSLPWTFALLPVLWVFQFAAMVGVGMILCTLGTYFRDLKEIVQVVCVAGMYFMPIFYLPAWVPGKIRPLLYLNPFSYMTWCYQDVCYFGRFEHPWAWPAFGFGSLVTLYVGYRVFRKLKGYFGSVL